MIVLVLGDEEGQQVLDRLLSSQVPQQHACACQQGSPEVPAVEPPAPEEDGDLPLWSGQPWTAEEDAAISGCASPLLAREAYRRVLQDECSAEQIEDEIEATGEPAGPVDSEIAAEMAEDAPVLCECTGKEVTLCAPSGGIYGDHTAYEADLMDGALCDAPPCAKPEEKKPRTRKDAWRGEEDAAIADAPTDVAAISAYRNAIVEGHRTDLAIRSRWRTLQKELRVGKTVRIINLSSSATNGKTGTIRKILDSGDCLVSVRGSPEQIRCSPDKLTVISGGST